MAEMKYSIFRETILPIFIFGITLYLLLFTGYLILNRMGQEYWIAVGFCIDKIGMYNITEYDYELIDYADMLNCSNKENPTGIDTAISTLR